MRTPPSILLATLLAGLALSALPRSASAVAEAAAPSPVAEAAYQFALAKMLSEEGSYDEALEAYRKAIELDDGAVYARLELAQFHAFLAQISRDRKSQAEHLRSAVEHTTEALEREPANRDALRAHGQVQLQMADRDPGAVQRAAEAFETLREMGSTDLQVLSSLGQIYLWRRQPAKAVEVLREATSSVPRHRALNAMFLKALVDAQQLAEAEEVARRLVEIEPQSIEYQLELAELLAKRGAHREAVAALRAAPAEVRSHPQVRHLLAGELHLAGDNHDALAEVEALLEEMPGRSSLRRLRVQVLDALLRYDEAIEALAPLVEAEAEEGLAVEGALLLSRLLERVGRPDDAAAEIERAIARAGDEESLRLRLSLAGVRERQGRFDDAVDLLSTEVRRAEPATSLPILARSLSEVLVRAGRPERAMEVLADAAERLEAAEETEAAERLRLARWAVLEEVGRWRQLAEGVEPLLGAARLETRLGARLLRGEALARLGRLEEALAVLREDGLEPRLERRLEAQRAEVLLRAGRVEEARELIEAGAGADAEGLLLAARIYQRVERYGEMVPLLERTLEREPESLEALFMLGSALERQGRHERAAEVFERLLEGEPDHAATLNYLGYMWADRGENLERAVALIEKAVRLEPDSGAYVDSLGWAYYRLGRLGPARRHLEWAARLLPDDPTVQEHLGDVYLALGDRRRARDVYRLALKLDDEGNADRLRRKLEELEEGAR